MFAGLATYYLYFGIGSIPTYILINPAGKVIARYGGGGEPREALDKKLAESFQ